MHKGRLEAFSDGVIAIIITIMVLELKLPEGHELAALLPLIPIFLSYVLSFINVGIYWNNHHHLFQVAKDVNGALLWANLHLLFWLSLFSFVTAWLGETWLQPAPVAAYGVVNLLAALAYFLLVRTLLATHPADSTLAKAIGNDWKGKISFVPIVFAIPLAFVSPWLSVGLYALVSLLWLIPDRRIEQHTKP